MKKLLILALGLSAMLTVPSAPAAVAVSVEVGDQPYYVHGPYYYSGGVRYVWVGGHWGWRHGRRVWIHGAYRARR